MKTLYFLLLLYLSSGAVRTITHGVTGYTGGAVVIKCEYDINYKKNKKYFCKDAPSILQECSDLIKTDGLKDKWVDHGRFSLYDNTTGGFFLVIFRDLTAVDTGIYYCAVDIKILSDSYRQVDLAIKEDACCMKAHQLSAFEGETVNISCKFPQEYKEHSKYFCKEFGHPGCKYRLSTPDDQTWVGDEKLSLHDNREGVLNVSISSFSTSDAGSYWCGVDMGEYKALITHVQLNLTKWCCVNTIRMTALFEGDSLIFSCPYPQGYEDKEKFFCKGESRDYCVDQITVKKSSVWLVNGTFSAFDDVVTKNVKVEMRGLRAEDSGIYWCGYDRRWKPANYTRVTLAVAAASSSSLSSSTAATSSSSSAAATATSSSAATKSPSLPTNASSGSDLVVPLSMSGTVGLLIIIIIIIILLIWRSKRNMTHVSESVGPPAVGETATGMQLLSPEVDYEEIKDTSHPVDPDIPQSVDNALYAMAEIPTTPSDDPHFTGVQKSSPPVDSVAYATVSFHRGPVVSDASCSVIRDSDAGLCDYTTVKKPAKPD